MNVISLLRANCARALSLLVASTAFCFQAAAQGPVGLINFDPRVDYSFAGSFSPYQVVLADVDGDGKADMVVSGYNGFSVYHNSSTSGSVDAGSFATKVDFTLNTAAFCYSLSVGDIDGDGRPDVALGTDNGISVFHHTTDAGTVNNGTFESPVDFTTGFSGAIISIATQDVDGDGKTDIVALSNNVYVFQNTATSGTIDLSSLAGAVPYTVLGIGYGANSMCIADVDGDGYPDIVSSGYGIVSVLQNTTGGGTAGFADGGSFSAGNGSSGVIAADIDGDGMQDLAVLDQYANTVAILRNNRVSIGTISFDLGVSYATGSSPSSLAAGDFDGDGKADIAVCSYWGQVVTTLRNASSTGSVVMTEKTRYTGTNGINNIAAGDLDGDGKADLAIVNQNDNTVSVLRNDPVVPIVSALSPKVGIGGTTAVTISGYNFNSSASNNIVYFGATRASVTSASTTSLQVTVPSEATNQPVSVNNTEHGLVGYSPYPFLPTFDNSGLVPGLVNFDPRVDYSFAGSFSPYQVVFSDVDGDGKADMVVSGYNGFSVYHNSSTSGSVDAGSFVTKIDFTLNTAAFCYSLSAADIDGDGRPDVVLGTDNGISIFHHTTDASAVNSGTFESPVDFTTGFSGAIISIATQDVDGDGKTDIVVLSNNVYVFQNAATKDVIDTRSLASAVSYNVLGIGYGANSMCIADVDGDGLPDIITSGYGIVSFLQNTSGTGSGVTGFTDGGSISAGNGSSGVIAADIDGDGKQDLAVLDQYANTVNLLRNSSSGIGMISFDAVASYATGSSPSSLAAGDFDGDGKVDIAVCSYWGQVVTTLRNTSSTGSVVMTEKTRYTGTNGINNIAAGDLDGDGKADLAIVNQNDNTVSVLRNDPVVPIVSALSPKVGIGGTTAVTISGYNFNSSASGNIVYFGATKASVTSASPTALEVTVPSEATNQPVSVNNTDHGLVGYSPYPFLPTFDNSGLLPGAINFDPHVDYSFAGSFSPYQVVFSDVDGDGKADMVVSGYNGFSVYHNSSTSGSVDAGSFATKVDFTLNTAAFCYSLSVGDIDGDGRPDVALGTDNGISVFHHTTDAGTVNNGTFESSVDFTTGFSGAIISIATQDVDGDGKTDIVVLSNNVYVFQNTATKDVIDTRSLASAVSYNVLGIGYGANSMCIADVDGDGLPDIITSGYGIVSFLQNTSGTGSGVTGFTDGGSISAGNGSSGVIAADIDGDGKQDLAVLDQYANTVNLLRNSSSGIGMISFDAVASYATGSSPSSLAAGDFDGDGKVDIAVCSYWGQVVTTLRNASSSGTIAMTKTDIAVTTNGINSIAAGDLDGDNKADLAIVNQNDNTVSVLRNDPVYVPAMPPTITSISPTHAYPGTSVTITGTNFNTTITNNTVYFGAVQATVTSVNTDGTSMTVTVPFGATYDFVSETNSAGQFTAYSPYPFLPTFDNSADMPVGLINFDPRVDFSVSGIYGQSKIILADIDGDGKPDMLSTYSTGSVSGFLVYHNNSTAGTTDPTSFGAGVDFVVTNPIISIAVGDINGDGKPDVITGGQSEINVFPNATVTGAYGISAATFGSPAVFNSFYGTPTSIAIADIDADGRPDIIAAAARSGPDVNFIVLRNTTNPGSAITMDAPTAVSYGSAYVGSAAGQDFAIADFNGDGLPDIITFRNNDNQIYPFQNASTPGTIVLNALTPITGATGVTAITTGDIDGDGNMDFVTANRSANSISVYGNTSTGGTMSFARSDFDAGVNPYSILVGSGGMASPYSLAVSDFNGDGKPDVAIGCYEQAICVLQNTGTGTGSISFAKKTHFTGLTTVSNVAAGDLDGDGRSDIAAIDQGGASITVFRNDPILPVITSVSQPAANPGSSVTISGYNFNSTPANNTVFFGATKAVVTSASTTALDVTVPFGATYGVVTVNNKVNGLEAYSPLSFLPKFDNSADVPAGVFNFDPHVDFATSGYYGMQDVILADVDGDGKADMITTYNAGGSTAGLLIYHNNSTSGSVTPGSFDAGVNFDLGTYINAIAVGDIDGDGKPDVLVASSGSVSVFRNAITTPGTINSSSFEAPASYYAGSPFHLAVSDVDGDGKADIVVTANLSDGSNVLVLHNEATSGVALTATSMAAPVSYIVGGTTTNNNLALADLDGDGSPEIITIGTGSVVNVLRNISTTTTVNSGFEAAVTFAAQNPTRVLTADVDGDGKTDIVTLNRNDNSVSVFLNTTTGGTLSFTRSDFAAGAGPFPNGTTNARPFNLSIGDFDGDGKADLAISCEEQAVCLLRNTSTGPGNVAFTKTTQYVSSGYIGSGIAAGDVDGDGRADIVAVNGGSEFVSVLRNSRLQAPPTVTALSPDNAYPGATVTITGTNFNTVAAAKNIVYFGGTQATVSAVSAGGDALTVQVPYGATYDAVSVNNSSLKLAGASGFQFVPTYDNSPYVPGVINFDPQVDFTTDADFRSIVLADINGDGWPDMVVAHLTTHTISVFLNNQVTAGVSPGSFTTSIDFDCGNYPDYIAVSDINNDGKPDLLITNQTDNTFSVFLNNTTVSTTPDFTRTDFAAGSTPVYVAAGDIDGDGKADVAVAANGQVTVYRNNSQGMTASFASSTVFAAGSSAQIVSLNDIDGDNKPDLVYSNGTNISVLLNTSATAGNISAASFGGTVNNISAAGVNSFAVGDINNDLKQDIVFTKSGANTVSVIRNTSTPGSFSFDVSGAVTATTGNDPFTVAIADIDGDSKPEVVTANYADNNISVFRNTTSSSTAISFAAKTDFTTSANPTNIAIGDVDRDGKPDLLVDATIGVLRNDPLAQITGTLNVCAGATTNLNDVTARGTWSSGDEMHATVSATGVVTGVAAGTATISYTLATGVSVTATVTVNALPDAGTITGTATVCIGASTTLNDATGGGVWSSVSTGVATIGTAGDVAGVSAGTTIISYTVNNSCGTTAATATVTVNPLPSAGTITGTMTVCVGSSTTLNDATGGGVWSSVSTGVATIGTAGDVAGVSAGTTIISYTVTNSCGTTAATATVTVNALPDAGTITGTATVCIGASTTLNDATGGGVWSSVSTGVAAIGTAGDVAGVSAGTTIISYTVTNSCGTTAATTTVTVNPLPSAGTITGTMTVCIGASTTLNDATGGGVWSSVSTGVATIGTAGDVTGVSAGTTIISYTVTNSCGTTAATAAVTVNPLPSAGTITGTMTVCVGASITLNDATGGGVWSSVSTGVATIGTAGDVAGVSAGTTIVSYTVNNSCGTTVATATVTVNPLPSAGTITGTTTVCAGAFTTLSDAAGGGVWSSGSTGTATVGTSGIVNGVSAGTAVISYTVTNSCGTGTATVNVTVNPAADAGTITGTTTVCAGAFTTLSDVVPGTAWNSSSTGIATVSINGVVHGLSAGTTVISFTVMNSCGTATTTTNVTVSPAADAGTITGTTTVCAGAFTTLSDAAGGGVWSSGSTGTATVGTSGIVNGVSAGTAVISYTVTNSCGTGTATVNVTVNPAADAGTITGTTTVCAGAFTTLSDVVSGTAWNSSSTGIATVSINGVVHGLSAGTTVISFTVMNSCGTATTTTNVTVSPAADAGTITGTTTVCGGAFITLSDAAGGGVWSSGSTGTATVGTSGIVNGVSAGTAVISYTVTNSCGTGTATVNVTVNPAADAGTITGTTTVCAGAFTTLSDVVPGTAWNSSSTGIATVSINGVVHGLSAGTTVISFTVMNSCGTATTTTNVTVSPAADAGTITGTTAMCVGSGTTLNDATSGGAWSSNNISVATIGISGVVNGAAPGTALISYSVTNSCGTAVATKTVTVNPLPTAATITGAASVNTGATISLADVTSGGTWSSSNPGIGSVNTSGVVTGVTAGTATISYTVTNGCGSVSATKVVTVVSAVGDISGVLTVCVGYTTSLSDATAGGTWSSAITGIASIGTNGVVTGVSAGTTTITYNVSGSYVTAVVSVNASPNIITGSYVMCEGLSTTLGETTTGGTWTSAAGTGEATVGSASGIVTGTSAGTVTISYTLGTGCAKTTTVTVNSTPMAIDGSLGVCVGTTSSLTDATGTGTWSSSAATKASVNAATGVVTGVAAGTATITYLLAGSCKTTATVSVTALPATITGTKKVCPLTTTTLADGTSGGTWSSSSVTVSVGSAGIITGVSQGTASISYTVGGCSATTLVTINPNPLPIAGSSSICIGSTASMSDPTPSGPTWSSSNTTVATISTSTAVATGLTAGTTTISYILSTGCYATTTLTVGSGPSAITGALNVLQGATTTLDDAVSGGTWSSTATHASVAAGTGNTGIVSGISLGTAIVTYSTGGGCLKTAVVSVNPLPAAITGYGITCVGTSTTLSDATTGGTWSSVAGTGTATISATGVVTGGTQGTATISYILPGGGAISTEVTVNPVPSVCTGTRVVCSGSTTTLSNTLTGGIWSSSNGAVATVGTSGIVTGTATGGTGTANITYSFGTGCKSATLVTVNILPAAISGAATACTGANTTLTDATAGGTWSSSDPTVASMGSTNNMSGNPLAGLTVGATTISYTLSTGCARALTVAVNQSPVAGSISGPTAIHIAGMPTIALSDVGGDAGGIWSSSNTAKGTVDASGNVTGIASGTTTISYSVTGNGCTSRATQVITITATRNINTSGNAFDASAVITLYPNPSKGTLTLTTPGSGQFSLFTLDGKEVKQYAVTEKTSIIQLPYDLAAGIYMCRYIGDDGERVVVRLVYEP